MWGKSNKNQAYDDAFVNEAWKDMANILDKEMPSEKKTRRIIPFWWWGLAASLVLGIGLFPMFNKYFSNKSILVEDSLVKTSKTDMGRVCISDDDNINDDFCNENLLTASVEHKAVAKSSISRKEQAVLSVESPVSTIQESVDIRGGEPSQNHSGLSFGKEKPSILSVGQTHSLPRDGKPYTQNTGDASLDQGLRPVEEVAPIFIKKYTLEKREEIVKIDDEIVDVLPTPKKWSWGIGWNNIIVNKWTNGLSAGLFVQRRISDKWAFETGLKFKYTNIEVGALEAMTIDSLSLDIESYDLRNDTVRVSYQTDFMKQIDGRSHNILMPIGLVFRPHAKLNVLLGGNLNFNLTKSREPLYAAAIEGSTLPENSDVSSQDFMNSPSTSAINQSFTTYWYLGMQYSLKEHTAIHLQFNTLGYYNKHFYNPLKNKYYQNYWELGVVHTWGGKR